MAQDQTENTEGSGCAGTAKKGCGCLGIGLGMIVLYAVTSWVFNNVFFYYPVPAWGIVGSVGCGVVGGIVGLFLRNQVGQWWRPMRALQRPLLGFGVVCLVTAIGMSLRPADVSIEEEVDPMGGMIGPIEVPDDNATAGLRIYQDVEDPMSDYYQRWSFITVEVLDEEKEYLSSLGGDVWSYAGYDGDYWEEEKEQYRATLEFPSAGQYYIQLKTEANVDKSELSPISFELHERAAWGNPTPFQWAAYFAFFVGTAFLVAPRVWRREILRDHLRDGGTVRFEDREWDVKREVHYTYDDWQSEEWTLHPTGPGGAPRYLEYEYEEDGHWSNWAVSEPLDLDEIQVDEGAGDTLAAYVAAEGTWPESITVDGRSYTLEDAGTGRRNGASFSYHNYKLMGVGFVTVEGEAPEDLSAVKGQSTSPSAFTMEKDEERAA